MNKLLDVILVDANFDYVTTIENPSEYIFYTINEVGGFVDYVEKLAKQ